MALWNRLRRRWRPPRRLTFTREGRIIVFLSVGVGFAAINTGNNLLYLLLGWLLSFIIASGILSEQTLRGLVVERRPPAKIFANEPFLMEVVIRNTKLVRASYSIEVEDLIGQNPAVPIDKRCYFLKIPEGKHQRTSYRHTFTRRGVYSIAGYRLATKFPFALFRKSKDVDEPLQILVYPARIAVQRPASRAQVHGETTASRLGRRGEFFGLRERRPGDDRRDIHWKSSARTGRLLVREYEDELARRVVIVVDNALPLAVRDAIAAGSTGEAIGPWSEGIGSLAPADEAKVTAVERAISTAASLAASYLETGWTVELVARETHVPPGVGRMHEAKIGKALALLGYVSDELAFATIAPRVETVLIRPRGVDVIGRPRTSSVVDV
jgi:uncharacterized protein (DUF58 family)